MVGWQAACFLSRIQNITLSDWQRKFKNHYLARDNVFLFTYERVFCKPDLARGKLPSRVMKIHTSSRGRLKLPCVKRMETWPAALKPGNA